MLLPALLLGVVADFLLLTACAAPLAITDVRIIDGNGGMPVEQDVVVTDRTQIVAVGPAAAVTIPADSTCIDVNDMSMLPGFADLQVHSLGSTNRVGPDLVGFQKYLDAVLDAGITTVLDTANVKPFILQLRAAVASGRIAGPRIYRVAPIIDGADPGWPALSVAISWSDQVPRVAAALAEAKVDFIELCVSPSDPLVRAISVEAHPHGMSRIVDQWRRNGCADLAGTGIAGLAHFPSHRISDEMIDVLVQSAMFFISMRAVQEPATGPGWQDLSFLGHALIAGTTSPERLDGIRKENGRHGGTVAAADHSTYMMQVDLAGADSNAPRLRDTGILFATGTDAFYRGAFGDEGLHRELELLIESGLTPVEAITAAPRSAAVIVGAAAEWGTLEPGKLANLLIVSGRPDRRLSDTRNSVRLVKEGNVADRAALTPARSQSPGFEAAGRAMAPVC